MCPRYKKLVELQMSDVIAASKQMNSPDIYVKEILSKSVHRTEDQVYIKPSDYARLDKEYNSVNKLERTIVAKAKLAKYDGDEKIVDMRDIPTTLSMKTTRTSSECGGCKRKKQA